MDFGKILQMVQDKVKQFNQTDPSVLGNVLTGQPLNRGIPQFGGVSPASQMVQNPDVVSPIPASDQLTSGMIAGQNLDAQNAANPAPVQTYPDIAYNPDIANAPVRTAETPPTSPTPTPSPTNDLWGQLIDAVNQTAPGLGYDASTLIRQKANESAFGTSDFAKNRFNFGGIGANDGNPNNAFTFKSIQDYLDYYYKMIPKRFPDAYSNRADPRKYLEGLKSGNYASNPNYVNDVLNTPLMPN
jgi:flagellum-specific peptidoglycan hydrolase FlgJ